LRAHSLFQNLKYFVNNWLLCDLSSLYFEGDDIMRTTGIKMLAGCLLLTIVLALTGCGGGGDSTINATPGIYKFTNAMLSGNTYNINGDLTGKYIFHTDGTVVATYPSGTETKSWTINSLGQLVLSSGGNTQVLTPASNSTTVIPCNIQFTNQVNPANNGNGGITLTLVDPNASTYKFTNDMISGKTYTFLSSDGFSGTITFNANGTSTAITTNGAATPSWIINSSGQLKLTHSDSSSDVLTPTSSSKTVIPCIDQYTDPLHPADNGTSTMTLTAV
jgi:hypothetical protein